MDQKKLEDKVVSWKYW